MYSDWAKRFQKCLADAGDTTTYKFKEVKREHIMFKQTDDVSCGLYVIRLMYYLMRGAKATKFDAQQWRMWIFQCIVERQFVAF